MKNKVKKTTVKLKVSDKEEFDSFIEFFDRMYDVCNWFRDWSKEDYTSEDVYEFNIYHFGEDDHEEIGLNIDGWNNGSFKIISSEQNSVSDSEWSEAYETQDFDDRIDIDGTHWTDMEE